MTGYAITYRAAENVLIHARWPAQISRLTREHIQHCLRAVGGIDLNRARIRDALAVALSIASGGLTVTEFTT